METLDRTHRVASPLSERARTFYADARGIAFLVGLCGLAVAGWGWRDWRGFFDDPCRSGVSAGIVILFAGTFLFGCNISTGRRDHSGNNWIFLPMFLVGLAMGWLPAYEDRRNLWTIGGSWVAYTGLILFCIGTMFRLGASGCSAHAIVCGSRSNTAIGWSRRACTD